MDKETSKLINENDELKLMVEGNGWGIARRRLLEKIIDLGDILGIEEPDPDKLSLEVAVNKRAIKILLDWLVSIESEKRNINVQEMLKKEKMETYLRIIK